MPYIVVARDDIPDGVLFFPDLSPRTSKRPESATLSPVPQTKYGRLPRRSTPRVASSGGVITLLGDARGLEAWFLANVDDGGGASLTPAEAVQNAQDVLDLRGSAMTLSAVNGALTTGSISAGQLPELLDLMAGRDFLLPAGTQIEAAGSLDVDPEVGAEGGPRFVEGSYRNLYQHGALTLSARAGRLSRMASSDFVYRGVAGAAVVLYRDDGSLY